MYLFTGVCFGGSKPTTHRIPDTPPPNQSSTYTYAFNINYNATECSG